MLDHVLSHGRIVLSTQPEAERQRADLETRRPEVDVFHLVLAPNGF